MSDSSVDKHELVRVACPACRTVYQIRRSYLGKKLMCAQCKVEWHSITPATLEAASDTVSDVDAELLDLSSTPGKSGQKKPEVDREDLRHDYWLGKQIGRYQIVSILGTGALGHVYRGHDAQLSRDVAIKILPKPKGEKMTLRIRLFLQEARAAARLQHPNIVSIHEVGKEGPYYFYAMEVVDGGTIKDLALALGHLSPARSCFLISQAAQALAYAHEKGVIHRDVKPDNLMMDARGVLKVADFGLAEIGELDIMKLYNNRPIGSPGYLAPETARGEEANELSDIYCLGLCLYFALTGEKLLRVPGNIQKTVALCANPPVFVPGRELSHVPSECLGILIRCLQHRPEDRYQTAGQLAEDLRRFVVRIGRDDSGSPLPLPGDDPLTGRLKQSTRRSFTSFLSRLFSSRE